MYKSFTGGADKLLPELGLDLLADPGTDPPDDISRTLFAVAEETLGKMAEVEYVLRKDTPWSELTQRFTGAVLLHAEVRPTTRRGAHPRMLLRRPNGRFQLAQGCRTARRF